MSKDKLKIKVNIEVEVDRQAYNREYNEKETADNIRAHVKGVIATAAESAFQNIPAITVKGLA